MEEPTFWIVTAIVVVIGFLYTLLGINRTYQVELTVKQLKDYFIRKHYCKECNGKLSRKAENEYTGKGWTNVAGKYS